MMERQTDRQKEGIQTKIVNFNASTRRHFDRHLSTLSRIYAVSPFGVTETQRVLVLILDVTSENVNETDDQTISRKLILI